MYLLMKCFLHWDPPSPIKINLSGWLVNWRIQNRENHLTELLNFIYGAQNGSPSHTPYDDFHSRPGNVISSREHKGKRKKKKLLFNQLCPIPSHPEVHNPLDQLEDLFETIKYIILFYYNYDVSTNIPILAIIHATRGSWLNFDFCGNIRIETNNA